MRQTSPSKHLVTEPKVSVKVDKDESIVVSVEGGLRTQFLPLIGMKSLPVTATSVASAQGT